MTGKVAADAELKKFYGEVLPPDQSAAQRITYLKIRPARAEGERHLRARPSNDVTQERDSALGKLIDDRHAVGRVPRHPALHPRARDGAGVPDPRTVALSQGSERDQALNVTVKVSIYFQAASDGI